jgi:hypothetical protein
LATRTIRLSTSTAMPASPCWAGKPRARSLGARSPCSARARSRRGCGDHSSLPAANPCGGFAPLLVHHDRGEGERRGRARPARNRRDVRPRFESLGHDPCLDLGGPGAPATDAGDHLEAADLDCLRLEHKVKRRHGPIPAGDRHLRRPAASAEGGARTSITTEQGRRILEAAVPPAPRAGYGVPQGCGEPRHGGAGPGCRARGDVIRPDDRGLRRLPRPSCRRRFPGLER